MMLVRIIANWDWPDLLRQSPNHSGIWEGIGFTLEPVEECDYVIVLNGASKTTTITCPPEHIWSMVQEPPTEFRKPWHVNPSYSFRMFTTDVDLTGSQYIHSQPALPWHINQDYDFLTSFKAPEKTQQLSWITSGLRVLKGHRVRMYFLEQIQGKLDFDLWGRDFNPIDDKWDGLVSYRYSLAIENYSNPLYWSEKLADCYLAWCMPIYYGCTRITDYFPAESLIQIDINQPDAAVEKIKEAIASNAWQQNLDAIAYARELILKRYQLFPFMVCQIRHFQATYGSFFQKQPVTIAPREIKERLWPRGVRKTKRSLVHLQDLPKAP
ncbi:glycosyltransferase family 10 [Moorena producens JHB]|uniref:Glycosyltransferase family 10 n=1 Tax=Moorena producens (strain JHB) TaxID=1454205 RepID=A0A1D9FY87_MOOP1|nr:glycosyltransferase family 10 [Moorena producens]AOY80301.2 glycosyltransferase family 10 [Moorena producens JHB]